MYTGTPGSRKKRSETHETRIGWRMAGLGMETVSLVAGGVLIGWVLGGFAEQHGWGGRDLWVVGGAIMGMATGLSQLIRGGLKLNKQLDRRPGGDGGDP